MHEVESSIHIDICYGNILYFIPKVMHHKFTITRFCGWYPTFGPKLAYVLLLMYSLFNLIKTNGIKTVDFSNKSSINSNPHVVKNRYAT